jgi:serine phosphatase RsbU (regulator of sigma subunit)
MLLMRGERTLRVHIDAPALGVAEGSPYQDHSYSLEAGDRLILYTDGLIEIDQGSTRDGLLRLIEVAQQQAAATNCADALIDGVLTASGATQPSDDTALLTVRFLGRHGAARPGT